MNIHPGKHPITIVIGPTASGKTDFSYKLAETINGEIINADLGQFYVPLTVGTAKPDWQSHHIKAHLFDNINTPEDFTVHDYAKQVKKIIAEIIRRGKTPIIVGGSLFYVKSLLFPTLPLVLNKENNNVASVPIQDIAHDQLWQELYDIDPLRAGNIHPNDIYRLQRALHIWNTTKTLPSLYNPQFNPDFSFLLIALNPEKSVLTERICSRTQIMLDQGWIEEAKQLIDTSWEAFINKKGMIGYQEIFEWLRNQNQAELGEVIKKIQTNTLQYAKRQITFMKSFLKQIPISNTATIFECDMAQNQGVVEAKRRFEGLLTTAQFIVGKKKVIR